MSTNHVVQDNDCFSSLGEKYGIPWQTLWNHPQNAALKQKRKNPNVLMAGDVVFIPDKKVKEESGATDKTHKFKKKTEKVWLRLRLLEEDKPRKNLKYTLEIGDEKITGTTDGNGKLEQKIRASATEAKLITKEDIFHLSIGRLDPIDETSGAEQRLRNLGYLGKGSTAADLTKATTDFQEKKGLDKNGALNDATKNQLRDSHGS